MPFGHLGRKSKPKNVGASIEEGYPAGEATQVSTDGIPSHQVWADPWRNPRPRSSVYSQPSISDQGGYIDPNAPPVPPLPATRSGIESLPPGSLKSRRECNDSADEPESPGGTREGSRPKHTPVSQYLRERAWMPQTPRPQHEIPPPSGRISALRKISIDSGKFSRRSSITALNGSTPSLAEPEDDADWQQEKPRKQSLSVSTPTWLHRRRSSRQTAPTSAQLYATASTTKPQDAASPKQSVTPALLRGFSKRHQTPLPDTSIKRSRTPIYYRTETLRGSDGRRFIHPALKEAPLMGTRTRNTSDNSDEVSWLFLGTMRGPTPSSVRWIDRTIEAALAKGSEKSTKKAIKEIRRLADNSSRATVEWVECYVSRKFGIELYA